MVSTRTFRLSGLHLLERRVWVARAPVSAHLDFEGSGVGTAHFLRRCFAAVCLYARPSCLHDTEGFFE